MQLPSTQQDARAADPVHAGTFLCPLSESAGSLLLSRCVMCARLRRIPWNEIFCRESKSAGPINRKRKRTLCFSGPISEIPEACGALDNVLGGSASVSLVP